MKNLLFVAVALFSCSFLVPAPAEAQTAIGVRGGVNFASLGGDVDLDTRTGIVAGAHLDFELSELWSAQPELSFTQKGSRDPFVRLTPTDSISGDRSTAISYLELNIPFTFKLNVRSERVQPRLYAGPAVAFKLSCKTKFEEDPDLTDTYDCDDLLEFGGPAGPEFAFTDTKSIDYGILVGAGLNLGGGPGMVTLDVRYNFGLANIHDVEPQNIKTRTLQILVGYKHRLRG